MNWHLSRRHFRFVDPDDGGGTSLFCELSSLDDLNRQMRPLCLAMICGALPGPAMKIIPEAEHVLLVQTNQLQQLNPELLDTLASVLCTCRKCGKCVGGSNPLLRKKDDKKEGDTETSDGFAELLYSCSFCNEINWTSIETIMNASPNVLEYLPYFSQPMDPIWKEVEATTYQRYAGSKRKRSGWDGDVDDDDGDGDGDGDDDDDGQNCHYGYGSHTPVSPASANTYTPSHPSFEAMESIEKRLERYKFMNNTN